MSRIDHGTVELRLGDDAVYTLKPTLQAMKQIDSQFGSIRMAIQNVSNLSFHSISFIITTGAGLTKVGTEKMEQELFDEGVLNVAGPIADFLSYLMSPSGRDEEPSEADEEEGGKG